MKNDGTRPSRRPCVNCLRRYVDHVDAWCLFAPTRYVEVSVAAYAREYGRMLNGFRVWTKYAFDPEDFTRKYGITGEWEVEYRWPHD